MYKPTLLDSVLVYAASFGSAEAVMANLEHTPSLSRGLIILAASFVVQIAVITARAIRNTHRPR